VLQLVHTASRGDAARVKALLDGWQLPHVDSRDNSFAGGTALLSAAWQGHLTVVEMLLDRGASINAKDSSPFRCGWTVLMVAARCGHRKMVEMLLARGADVRARDSLGYAAEDLATTEEIKDLLKVRDLGNGWALGRRGGRRRRRRRRRLLMMRMDCAEDDEEEPLIGLWWSDRPEPPRSWSFLTRPRGVTRLRSGRCSRT
jgi:hypothetical protein